MDPSTIPDPPIPPEPPSLAEAEAASIVPAASVLPSWMGEEVLTVRPVLPGPGFWGAVGFLVLMSVAEFGAGIFLGMFLAAARFRVTDLRESTFLTGVSQSIGSLTALLLAWLVLGRKFRRAAAIRGIRPFHLLLALLLLPVIVIVSEEINRRVTQMLEAEFGPSRLVQTAAAPVPGAPVGYIKYFDDLDEQLARQPWWVVILVGCLLPGTCEEVFFRGFLGRGLVARYGAVGGVLLTSLFFGLMHIDPVRIAYTFVLGIVLHVLYLNTKTLLAPMLLHTLYNVVGFGSHKLGLEGKLNVAGPDGWLPISSFLLLSALVALVTLVVLLYQARLRWQLADGRAWNPSYRTAETPPALVGARPVRSWPGAGTSAVAVCIYLVFGVALGTATAGWLQRHNATALISSGNEHMRKSEFDQALADFNEAVRIDPDSAIAYCGRSEAYRLKGNLDKAQADCNQALRLDPKLARAYVHRGEIDRLRGDPAGAISDCDHALRLDPQLAFAYTVRGAARHDQHQYAAAIADYEKALQIQPDHSWTHRNMAWLLASCPEEKLRDGRKALQHAQKACALSHWRDSDSLAALAAAHAECGEFVEAVEWQEKAEQLAQPAQREMLAAMRALYQTHQPYRFEKAAERP